MEIPGGRHDAGHDPSREGPCGPAPMVEEHEADRPDQQPLEGRVAADDSGEYGADEDQAPELGPVEQVHGHREGKHNEVPSHLKAPQHVLPLHEAQHEEGDRAVVEQRRAGRAALVGPDEQRHGAEQHQCAQVFLDLDVEAHRVRQPDHDQVRKEHPVVSVQAPQRRPIGEMAVVQSDGVHVIPLIATMALTW